MHVRDVPQLKYNYKCFNETNNSNVSRNRVNYSQSGRVSFCGLMPEKAATGCIELLSRGVLPRTLFKRPVFNFDKSVLSAENVIFLFSIARKATLENSHTGIIRISDACYGRDIDSSNLKYITYAKIPEDIEYERDVFLRENSVVNMLTGYARNIVLEKSTLNKAIISRYSKEDEILIKARDGSIIGNLCGNIDNVLLSGSTLNNSDSYIRILAAKDNSIIKKTSNIVDNIYLINSTLGDTLGKVYNLYVRNNSTIKSVSNDVINMDLEDSAIESINGNIALLLAKRSKICADKTVLDPCECISNLGTINEGYFTDCKGGVIKVGRHLSLEDKSKFEKVIIGGSDIPKLDIDKWNGIPDITLRGKACELMGAENIEFLPNGQEIIGKIRLDYCYYYPDIIPKIKKNELPKNVELYYNDEKQ